MVCGQAEAVHTILRRSSTLPPELSLTIEELLENAWEIAYRRPQGSVIAFPLPHIPARSNAFRQTADRQDAHP